ncbi:MAG: porphobilinogen synthase [Crocinitomicaceae bacterium]|nr:porphobilinogen synthase [Crocinitomicaceae bacterium]
MLNRPRRNRKHPVIREMIEETVLRPSNLIYPIFLSDSSVEREAISSLPDQFRLNLEGVFREIEACLELGLKTFVLFPVVPENLKDSQATYGLKKDNFYLEAIRKIKAQFPGIVLMSDVALDPYSSDGHDGLVKDGEILNDETLPILAQMSVEQAQAGIDIIGPSDMMDGRVREIREALDKHQMEHVSIMSYTAKYASAFYGPFRDALDSAPKSGDKKTYQMNPANKKEALREAELDEMEGADFLMVKPALAYLDVIHVLKENSMLPIAAYNVSGEYAMLKAACANGWLEYDKAMPEMLLSMKRAGADSILTYFAKDFAALYKKLL